MSIYNLLSTPVPTIAYCAMHQALPQVPREEYLKTMREFHERLAHESAVINADFRRFLQDTVARHMQLLRTSLSHFLQTPISTDNEHVEAMLTESLEKFRDQLLTGAGFGLQASTEGRVFVTASKKAVERKLLLNGKNYLGDLGFKTGKTAPDIFESVFLIDGGMNLDVLEHLVRDVLGIYATTHGKHIQEFGSYAYAAYNLVHARGETPGREERSRYVELAFFFSKPDVKYAPFRSGLVTALDELVQRVGVDHLSLWQRKLGLGAGKEFVLRIICENPNRVSRSVKWLDTYKRDPFVREAVIEDGHLLVKELLF